jgi:PadR family transcriptional regulator PadR
MPDRSANSPWAQDHLNRDAIRLPDRGAAVSDEQNGPQSCPPGKTAASNAATGRLNMPTQSRGQNTREVEPGGFEHACSTLTLPYSSMYKPRMKRKTNPDFLNGVPELLILQLLDRRAMHGYDLVQAIRDASGMKLDFGEGCIYPVLHRLEEQKILSSRRELVGGRNRIVYRVTRHGQKRLAQSLATWQEIVAAVNTVLQGGTHGQAAMA